jgi:hypothetical protein
MKQYTFAIALLTLAAGGAHGADEGMRVQAQHLGAPAVAQAPSPSPTLLPVSTVATLSTATPVSSVSLDTSAPSPGTGPAMARHLTVAHNPVGGFIDLSAASKPSAWLMLLVGAGVIGFVIRRRAATAHDEV